MNALRVWISAAGSDCRVRVDDMKSAQWLLALLSRSFVFKSCEPIREVEGPSCCTFHVRYTSQLSRYTLEKLLAAIPQVQLMSEPA